MSVMRASDDKIHVKVTKTNVFDEDTRQIGRGDANEFASSGSDDWSDSSLDSSQSSASYENIDENTTAIDASELPTCPFAKQYSRELVRPEQYHVTDTVSVAYTFGSMAPSNEQAALLQDIGGVDRLREMFSRFYEMMFTDRDLNKFVTDIHEPHADRFATWLAEKMSAEPLWSPMRRGMRQPSHFKAWNCAKRPRHQRGLHFKLHDCRRWLRLNLFALRRSELDQHDVFVEWYLSFLEHFIAVYERKAPPFVREEWAFTADESNFDAYVANNRAFDDV